MKSFREKIVEWAKAVPDVLSAFIHNESSYEEIGQKLQTLIDGMDNPQKVHFVRAVFNDYFVYRVESANQPSQLWKQSYTVKDNGEVELGDELTKVSERTEYIAVNLKDNNNKNKENEKMSDKQKKAANEKPCCEEKVQMLIENEATHFGEDDREWLLNLAEDQIDKLMPKEPEKPAKKDPEKDDDGETPVAAAAKKAAEDALKGEGDDKKDPQPKTAEQYIADAPPEIREVLNHGLQIHNQRKSELVKVILANKRNRFSEDQLKNKPVSELEAIAALSGEKDFSGQGGVVHNDDVTNGAGDPLTMPSLVEEKK